MSISGTFGNAEQPSNMQDMFVAALVFMLGTEVNAEQPSNM